MTLQLQFTRKGKDTGDVFEPIIDPATKKLANDVHLNFETDENKHAKLEFKDKNGKSLETVTAPDNARDVGIEFQTAADDSVTFRQYHWTDEKGDPIDGVDGYKSPPDGTQEAHLDVEGKIVDGGYWTYNGWRMLDGLTPVGNINQPRDVNDAHLVPEPQRPTLVTQIKPEPPTEDGLALILPLARLKTVLHPFLSDARIRGQEK